MGLGAVLLLAASWLALGPVAVASGASNAGKEARAPVGRAADSVLLSDGFSGPDRLLTNEFAYWNRRDPRSHRSQINGTRFRRQSPRCPINPNRGQPIAAMADQSEPWPNNRSNGP